MSKSKGSAIMRIAKYFRETEFDEARMAFKLASEIMDGRFKENASVAKSQSRAVESRPRRQGQGARKMNVTAPLTIGSSLAESEDSTATSVTVGV